MSTTMSNVVGNVYDKYSTRNPIARLLMGGFLREVLDLYTISWPRSVLEVGCGEGRLAQFLHSDGPKPDRFVLSDLDVGRVDPSIGDAFEVVQASVYDLPWQDGEFDLVICCEVLEHVDDPDRALAEIARVASRRVLVSTPWEPVWRCLNMARGKYLSALGNTPGHVQHFTRRGLVSLGSRHLRLLQCRTPLPWTILLGEPLRR